MTNNINTGNDRTAEILTMLMCIFSVFPWIMAMGRTVRFFCFDCCRSDNSMVHLIRIFNALQNKVSPKILVGIKFSSHMYATACC
jgi:hypothetical protein